MFESSKSNTLLIWSISCLDLILFTPYNFLGVESMNYNLVHIIAFMAVVGSLSIPSYQSIFILSVGWILTVFDATSVIITIYFGGFHGILQSVLLGLRLVCWMMALMCTLISTFGVYAEIAEKNDAVQDLESGYDDSVLPTAPPQVPELYFYKGDGLPSL